MADAGKVLDLNKYLQNIDDASPVRVRGRVTEVTDHADIDQV